MHHELKIKDPYYKAIVENRKKAELRFNDRDYQTGDTISFIQLTDDGMFPYGPYEGKWEITHVLSDFKGLEDGWVILSLKKM